MRHRARHARPPAEQPRTLGRRPVLDGVRGTAVLLVMLEHTGVLHNGFMGVDVFFALSGFLITTLLTEEWERRGQISLRGFYERRARRLLPALWWVVAAAIVVNYTLIPLATSWSIFKRAGITLLFATNWVAGFGHSGQMGALNPTWSLGEEEQFYLLWPIVLIFLLRRRVRPWAIVGLLAATILGLLILDPYVFRAFPGYSHYYSPLNRAAELLFGCCGALIWHHRLIKLPGARWAGVGATALVAGFAYVALFTRAADERLEYLVACGLALPALILLIESPNSPLARLFSCRPLRHMGRISYCVYLCHLVIRELVQHYFPGHSVYFNFAGTLIGSVVVASISWHFLESRVSAPTSNRRRMRAASLRGQTPIRSSA